MPSFIASVFLSVVCSVDLLYAGSVSQFPGTGLWPTTNDDASVGENGFYTSPKVTIDYYTKTLYPKREMDVLRGAMTEINRGSKNCIAFRGVTTNPPVRHALHIRNQFTDASLATNACKSPFYGYANAGNQVQGQTLVMFGPTRANGSQGCLSSAGAKPKETLRVLLNVLGMTNEYQRPDRDLYMDIPADAGSRIRDEYQDDFAKQSETDVFLYDEFDVQSATMISGTEYAKNPREPVFTLKTSGDTVQTAARLSQKDCEALSAVYHCDISCDPDTAAEKITPAKLDVNMHCWKTVTSLAVNTTSRQGFLGELMVPESASPAEEDSLNVRLVSLSANAQLEKTTVLKSSRIISLYLKNKITEGDTLTVRVEVTRRDGKVVAEGDITVGINCYPRLTFLDQEKECYQNPSTPAAGLANDECETTLLLSDSNGPVEVDCDASGRIRNGYQLGFLQVTDPDCPTSSCPLERIMFDAVDTTQKVSAGHCYWTLSQSGRITWYNTGAMCSDGAPGNGTALPTPAEVTFRMVYHDYEEKTMVKYEVPTLLQCKPPSSRVLQAVRLFLNPLYEYLFEKKGDN